MHDLELGEWVESRSVFDITSGDLEAGTVPRAGDTSVAGDDAFDLGGKSQETPLETPMAEAVGTTVGDDNIGNTTVGGNTGADDDWGNSEEAEDFFGVVASQQIEPAQAVDQTPGAHVVQAESKAPEKSEWDRQWQAQHKVS